MEESKDTKKGLACPFCGAPYKDVISTNVAQVKCEYCGGIFPISPSFKGVVPRCPNHPETFATGLCNDCGEHFYTQCLQIYNLTTDSAKATLYLCPECLRIRELKKANGWIYLGVLFLIFGFFVLLVNPIAAILVILFTSVLPIVYGIYKRGSILEESSENSGGETVLTRKVEVSGSTQDVDTDTLYSKMLSKYATRLGVLNAKELLDNEIYAYVRCGLDYEEAVRRVALNKGIIKAETGARAKAEVEAQTEEEAKPKEMRESKMLR